MIECDSDAHVGLAQWGGRFGALHIRAKERVSMRAGMVFHKKRRAGGVPLCIGQRRGHSGFGVENGAAYDVKNFVARVARRR